VRTLTLTFDVESFAQLSFDDITIWFGGGNNEEIVDEFRDMVLFPS
jgi:hypothetical protein